MSETLFFDRNENTYGPAPACFESLATATVNQLSCYSKDYLRGVKSILSERIAADSGVPEKKVLLGYGGEDILKQAVHCYLEKDETILIPTHSWWYYKSIADEKGGITLEYPMLPHEDRFTYDVDTLLQMWEHHQPRLILISSPNNPTGNALPFADLQRILATVRDTVVVLDEAYWGFVPEPEGYVRTLLAQYPRIAVIRTFSKLYALAGARIGYAFLGEELDRLSRFSARYLGYNRVSERLALAALDAKEYYATVRENMRLDRERFYAEIGTLPGFRLYRSEANFVLADIPPAMKPVLKSALAARNLSVKFFDERYLEHSIRISLGTREENHVLIEAMKEIVAATPVQA
jgi:histidinol-phosphate aminotransferase